MRSQGWINLETAWEKISDHAQGTKRWTNEAKMGYASEQAIESRVRKQNEDLLRLLRPLS